MRTQVCWVVSLLATAALGAEVDAGAPLRTVPPDTVGIGTVGMSGRVIGCAKRKRAGTDDAPKLRCEDKGKVEEFTLERCVSLRVTETKTSLTLTCERTPSGTSSVTLRDPKSLGAGYGSGFGSGKK
ncbi:MAG: hypothetical protein Q8L48_08465 [Archangium sp.]|nr:hypothetical protein [Archangium sp.]